MLHTGMFCAAKQFCQVAFAYKEMRCIQCTFKKAIPGGGGGKEQHAIVHDRDESSHRLKKTAYGAWPWGSIIIKPVPPCIVL